MVATYKGWRNAVGLHHLPEGTHSLAPKPGSLVRLAFQKWSVLLLLAKSQRGEGLENLLSPGFLRGLGLAVFLEKESFRKNEHPTKPLGQETVIAPVHDVSTFHVSFLLNGPRGRICTCNIPGLSGTPLHWATRGSLRTATSAPGQDCTDTKRGLSPLPLLWATGA